jgi:hypothetical protein
MTPEELAAKIAELEQKNAASEARYAELEAKIPTPPPVADPDEAYKPKSWKELHDTTASEAEKAAVKALQDAEARKENERKKQEDAIADQNKKIEETFKKMEEAGDLKPSASPDDEGGRQRGQILGALVSLGGTQLENAVKLAKSAWDSGNELSYDRGTNTVSVVRTGGGLSAGRNVQVGSSASRVVSAGASGKVNIEGTNGDLGAARERWLAANPGKS